MQQQFLEIQAAFLCRTTFKNKDGKHPVILRLRFQADRKDIFTGVYCTKTAWDKTAQRIKPGAKDAPQANQRLERWLIECNEHFNALKYSGKVFFLRELVQRLKGKEDLPPTIIAYLDHKAKELKMRVGIDITKATLQKYLRCAKYLEEFLRTKYKHDDLNISAITETTINDYFYYLRVVKGNSHNTCVKCVKSLKTVLMHAIKNGMLKTDPFLNVKLSEKPVFRGFLTKEELEKLHLLNNLHEGQKQVRDIFLFACYTGMAYIDVKQFSKKNLITNADGSTYIHKPRQKTGQLSIIPLLPPAEKILLRYSPTGNVADFDWKVITNQKINEHLKDIAKLAGLEQSLFFHLARHTFATTVTLSNGIPIETVSRMLGHTNIKMTQRYAKISGHKIIEDMKRIRHLFED